METEKTRIRVVGGRVVTIKKGCVALREAIKGDLAKKGSRAGILIGRLAADKGIVWMPAALDGIASELRYLAYQIRNLQNAKTATEEA